MNAAGSVEQEAAGITDSPALLVADTVRSGKGLSSEALVDTVATHSADAVRFLSGFNLNLSDILQLGGHSRARTHRAAADGKPMNIGYRIMSTLISHLQQLQDSDPSWVRILVNSRALQLLTSEEEKEGGGVQTRVVGVRVEKQKVEEGGSQGQEVEDIKGSSVILATGGYSADKQGLLKEHAPCFSLLPTTNGPFATGDGVRLGKDIGAALMHMDQVQVHPTGLVDPKDPLNGVKILGPESLRGSGGILLNHLGRRFVNELDTRDNVVRAMLQECAPFNGTSAAECGRATAAEETGSHSGEAEAESKGQETECCPVPSVVAHLILTQEGLERFGEASAKFYLFKGLMRKFSSLTDLCQQLGLPEDNVRETLREYNRAAEKSSPHKDPFGKTLFPCSFEGAVSESQGSEEQPLYAAVVTPVLHYCMGGLAFDSHARVLRDLSLSTTPHPAPVPIPGLLAAGEVTGGLHGANRLAGNSLLECVVFGRIAASTSLMDAASTVREDNSGFHRRDEL